MSCHVGGHKSGKREKTVTMRILVTGSSGFLGKKLIKSLTGKGHECITFDYSDGQNILSKESLSESFKSSPDVCVHLAAVADLNFFRKDPEGCERINIQGTKNVIDACARAGARMIFASTCCCYGNNNCHPSDEESPLAPTEPYAKSKQSSEADVLAAGPPHTVMRLATFYGPGMRPALCPAVFIAAAAKGETIFIHGDGKQTRTFTFVDDIVSGIVTIVESEPRYRIVNVTCEESVSVLEIAKLAMEVTGNDVAVEHVQDRAGQILREEISNARLRSLGWKPLTTFAEGMKRSYEDYTSSGGWLQSVGVSGGEAAK